MDGSLRDFLPHIVAMLAGGLATSLGLSWLARRPRGRALLTGTKGWLLAILALLAVGAGGGAVYWLVGFMLDAAGGANRLPSAGGLFVFGVLLGLPLSLPTVVMTWSEARADAAARQKRRDHPPTKDERRAFASDLARQIRELSVPPREVEVGVGGDGGRVLTVEGALDAKEGRRLVAALRKDLKDLGFKRVEGGGSKGWWERV